MLRKEAMRLASKWFGSAELRQFTGLVSVTEGALRREIAAQCDSRRVTLKDPLPP